MLGIRFLAVLAALAMPAVAVATTPEPVASPLSADSTFLADALSGQRLKLSMRGTTVEVLANAVPAEDGCAALVSAQAPGSNRKWSRLYRWSELAWTGEAHDGATMVTFFQQEGHAPVDRIVLRSIDGQAFRDTALRLAAVCRAARGEAHKVAMSAKSAAPGCYFARLPALQLHDSPAPARAVLTVLSHETPEAELQLLAEHSHADAKSDGWERPIVTFTFADPKLKDLDIVSARFALDGKLVAAEHAVTAYGDTRVRIRMDPFMQLGSAKASTQFSSTLASRERATLTLLDSAGQVRAEVNFVVAPALVAARNALGAAKWSCAGASPPPATAAHWQTGR